jgi:hypothetical protein
MIARRKPTRASSDARSGGDERGDQPQQRGARLRTAAHPQHADRLVGDAQLVRLHPGAAREHRALVGGRARRDGEHRARAVGEHQARVERPGGRPDDLRQAGPGLDGIRDGLESGEVEPGVGSLGRNGHDGGL